MKSRNIISIISAISIFVGIAPCVAVASSSGIVPVIDVTFDDEGDGFSLYNGASLTAGRSGNALLLDGSDDYAVVNSITSKLAQITGDFTISVWCNPENTTVWSRIYDFGNGSDGPYFFLTASSGSYPRFAVKPIAGGGEQLIDSTEMLTTGSWHNITITRSGNNTTCYTDGYQTGTSTSVSFKFSELGALSNCYIGKSQWPDPYFKGSVDDLKIYNTALDESQVRSLAAEAYTAKQYEKVYKNNCYVIDTKFYNEDKEIFSFGSDISVTDKFASKDGAGFTLNGAAGKDTSSLFACAAEYDGNILKKVNLKTFDANEINSDSYAVTIPVSGSYDNVRLFAWNGMIPIEPIMPVTAKVNVENDTMNTGTVTAALCSVDENGSETELASNSIQQIAPLEIEELSIKSNSIPANTKKLIVKITTDEGTYNAAALYSGIQGPLAAPPDSDFTTNGAHDPSIVLFPDDDTYYAYSSHHLIFTSKNLINWKKYDFTNITAGAISPKSLSFINSNYSGTTMNTTYWAPDVIYVPEKDAQHPYWMYISISCGLGGRNSVISLMKSNSPLFWADPDSDIIDAGVVFATKEASGYITNAIDANIYTDTDGSKYFIWGSFWGGIQAARLTDDGFVDGIDYSSDSTILATCKNFGTSVYTQKNGVAGPEGAWMHESGNHRYMFTSYGWLGSNYNTRVARSALSQAFGTDMGTQLKDANNIVMGTQHSKGSLSSPSGYKLIGSYRLGSGAMDISNDGYNYYVPREAGDAHVYYGSGHNSAITAPSGDEFYCSHFRKDAVEGAAILQIRKMLYTSDGWPIVSPVSYAGEIEQPLPEEMLYGTYDLASVGRTKMDGSSINTSGSLINRNYDLPVLSSKVTLNSDGSMADGLGTWTFDNDHTVTLRFAKNGSEAADEFYKSGDIMTLYALYGYDKDECAPVIALTGTDQNHITQFAKKSMAQSFRTPAAGIGDTEPIAVSKSAGGNPELGFDRAGNILYAGDPAATVIGDTVYLIAGHDTSQGDSYVIPEWVLYTSKNMTDWEYKGAIMSASDISWRNDNTSAWASQMVEYNGKYYLYFCTWDKTSSGKQSIGVAVANDPEGPYVDALGKPLISGSFTTPETSAWNDIDPTVLIDTDSSGKVHRYLAWGNGKYYICELNEDMISVKDIDGDNAIVMNKDIKERTIKSMGTGTYTEAPWLYKHNGKYYMFYAMNWREEMAYAMADEPMGRYDFKQIIMPPTATSNTNHPSVIDFNGKTYFIYHNGALHNGSGYRRSICIDELKFDENGYVYPLTETSIGLTGTASVIKTIDNKYIGHSEFVNPLSDNSYPITAPLVSASSENGYNTAWELVKAKAAPSGENEEYFVSIQSVNKPGLYITSTGDGVALKQDTDSVSASAMTFKTVKGLDKNNDTVSFESVSDTGKYLTVSGTGLTLSYGTNPSACSFIIDEASETDISVINAAQPEPEQEAEADLSQSFDSLNTGRLIYINTVDTPEYTAIDGITLYVGTRSNGPDATSNFSIQTGGVTGNALVLNAGKFQSASRGPRMRINTPAIPDGYSVTAEIKVKQGVSGSVLRYNDSPSNETGTEISGISTSWSTLKISITNDNYTYSRIIKLNEQKIAEDNVSTFPILWGTTLNSTGQSILFDDLTVKATKNQ